MNNAIQAWLDKQCGEITGATGGVVMLVPRSGDTTLTPAASWPIGRHRDEDLEHAARAAYEQRAPLTQPRLNGAQRPVAIGPVISHPIQVKGRTVGALAVT